MWRCTRPEFKHSEGMWKAREGCGLLSPRTVGSMRGHARSLAPGPERDAASREQGREWWTETFDTLLCSIDLHTGIHKCTNKTKGNSGRLHIKPGLKTKPDLTRVRN